MSIRARIEDTLALMQIGRYEGALLSVLVAIAATSRKRFPEGTKGDRDAFESFLGRELPRKFGIYLETTGPAITVEIADKGQQSLEHVLYKWFRCELAHEGALPSFVSFEGDPNSPSWYFRAGDAQSPFVFARSNLHFLIRVVTEAEENRGEFSQEGKSDAP